MLFTFLRKFKKSKRQMLSLQGITFQITRQCPVFNAEYIQIQFRISHLEMQEIRGQVMVLLLIFQRIQFMQTTYAPRFPLSKIIYFPRLVYLFSDATARSVGCMIFGKEQTKKKNEDDERTICIYRHITYTVYVYLSSLKLNFNQNLPSVRRLCVSQRTYYLYNMYLVCYVFLRMA